MNLESPVPPASAAAAASANRVRVGVAGATGFAGRELIRLLARHPHVRLTMAMASSAEGRPRRVEQPARGWEGEVVPLAVDALADACDVALLAVPDAAAARIVPALVQAGRRVIDLSGAFRLRDPGERARWYPETDRASVERIAPDAAAIAYGLTELHREQVRGARLIANPGCYPTAALLALQPLVAAGLIDEREDVLIDAKSGISGAGQTPTDRTHFSTCHANVSAYGLFAHRHTPEIGQALGRPVTFVPHLVPLDRGILTTIYARVQPGTLEAGIARTLSAAYDAAPFVRLGGDTLPEIRDVAHTNFCDIGWRFDPPSRRVVIISCLDNLLKGAAGQAVQNLNVMLGFDERSGLPA
ncbi:MAG TPA: N-acetyl-gamma-glutamyl-phosphate reductase [Vicinamibacterales bacterium]|nr:N-acetyl-gamma-glutamyl-phosphate reductase [Vicinamibacterales bacterium]